MTTISPTPSRPQLAVVQGRKRSFGRVFDRIKTVFKRRDNARSTSSRSMPLASTLERHHESAHTSLDAAFAVATLADSRAITYEEKHNAFVPLEPAMNLVVDDEEDILETSDEPFVPLASLGRVDSGLPEAKTRQLFARHGLTYHMRRLSDTEPATKMRRVEKQARMRVRWTCHTCSAAFGSEQDCPACGHRRCLECIREPGRRMKLPELEVPLRAISTAPRPATAPVLSASAVIQSISAKHDNTAWQCTIQIGRPRVDSRVVRQTCHRCEHPFQTAQARCSNCQHETCGQCPTTDRMQMSTVTPTVERVYKKPRQRVRYNCEFCNILFSDRKGCSGCGHERCENCPRYPPRKAQLVHDATALKALQARLTDVPTPTDVVAATVSTTPDDAVLPRL